MRTIKNKICQGCPFLLEKGCVWCETPQAASNRRKKVIELKSGLVIPVKCAKEFTKASIWFNPEILKNIII